jgi:hypothetical protein
MNKSAVIGMVICVLAASFASAASVIKSVADADADFCFGYAICQ